MQTAPEHAISSESTVHHGQGRANFVNCAPHRLGLVHAIVKQWTSCCSIVSVPSPFLSRCARYPVTRLSGGWSVQFRTGRTRARPLWTRHARAAHPSRVEVGGTLNRLIARRVGAPSPGAASAIFRLLSEFAYFRHSVTRHDLDSPFTHSLSRWKRVVQISSRIHCNVKVALKLSMSECLRHNDISIETLWMSRSIFQRGNGTHSFENFQDF